MVDPVPEEAPTEDVEFEEEGGVVDGEGWSREVEPPSTDGDVPDTLSPDLA